MSPDPDTISPTEEETEEQQIAYLRAVEALLARFKRYPSGFSNEEITRIEQASAALEYPGFAEPGLWRRNQQTSKSEKVDQTPTVIYLPHSLDPEERKRIGYPLTPEDKEEISRRLHERDDRWHTEHPTSPEEQETLLREAITALKTIMFPATQGERETLLKEIEAAKKKRTRFPL